MTEAAPFFFCSDECFGLELNRHIPSELEIGKTIGDDPEYKRLLKDRDDYLARLWPTQRIYSNEELAERQADLQSEQEVIDRFESTWATRRSAAIRQAVRRISEIWYSHAAQQLDKDQQKRLEKEREERRKEEAKEAELLAEELAFQELIAPRPIPEHLRVHTAIIAKTGWGKTQCLQHLILHELQKPQPPSLVVLDSTGAMVGRLQKLAIFDGPLRDRLLIIDPVHSPALNMFDISSPRFRNYSAEQQESVQTDVIGLFNYIFSSKQYDLSGPQGLGFTHAVRLILSRRGYTVVDLMRLLQETPKRWDRSSFAEDIRQLDEHARDFFEHHFYADALNATKAAIARRLHALIAIPTFRRMFTAGSNVLDLYSETQDKGSIVLVNTNQQLLGRDGYILFGRYVVARMMAAMLERAHIPQQKRRLTHLLIDEAAPYFDDSFDDLLTQVRQYGLRVTIAFQHLEQLDDKLKNSVAGQTSVKYIGGLSPLDERRIAAQIRCEPQFITDLGFDTHDPPQWSEWAVYVDGFTKHPMQWKLPFYALERQPQMTEGQHEALIQRNKTRVSSVANPDRSLSPPIVHAQSQEKASMSDVPEAGATY